MKFSYVGKSLKLEMNKREFLILGDFHIGFEEDLNYSGIMITRTFLKETKKEIEHILKYFKNLKEVIFLGDLKHKFSKNSKQEWKEIIELFDFLFERIKPLEKIVLIRGNHDNYLKKIIKNYVLSEKRIVEMNKYYCLGEICFVHGDCVLEELKNKEIKKIIMGHGHPALYLREGLKLESYKCFLKGKWNKKDIIILPSFINYRAGVDVRGVYFKKLMNSWNFDWKSFEVDVIEKEKIYPFGKLMKIKNS